MYMSNVRMISTATIDIAPQVPRLSRGFGGGGGGDGVNQLPTVAMTALAIRIIAESGEQYC